MVSAVIKLRDKTSDHEMIIRDSGSSIAEIVERLFVYSNWKINDIEWIRFTR